MVGGSGPPPPPAPESKREYQIYPRSNTDFFAPCKYRLDRLRTANKERTTHERYELGRPDEDSDISLRKIKPNLKII